MKTNIADPTLKDLLRQERFKEFSYLSIFCHLKEKGFPSDQGSFFKLIDEYKLTEENLLPLGWEVAGRNLVQIRNEVILA